MWSNACGPNAAAKASNRRVGRKVFDVVERARAKVGFRIVPATFARNVSMWSGMRGGTAPKVALLGGSFVEQPLQGVNAA
jgi:hypothetical protein